MPKLRHAKVLQAPESFGRGGPTRKQARITMTIEDPDEPKPIKVTFEGPQKVLEAMAKDKSRKGKY